MITDLLSVYTDGVALAHTPQIKDQDKDLQGGEFVVIFSDFVHILISENNVRRFTKRGAALQIEVYLVEVALQD